jgi:hypothetical protein
MAILFSSVCTRIPAYGRIANGSYVILTTLHLRRKNFIQANLTVVGRVAQSA